MAPLLVVCIEGGDADLATSLIEAGKLPALAELRRRGAAVTCDLGGDLVGPAHFTPLLTGGAVGDLGLAHFLELDPSTMSLRLRREGDLEPFWLHLPDRGRGCLALDVPDLHPHPESLADCACCWHSFAPAHRPYVTSPELEERLRVHAPPSIPSDPVRRYSLEEDRRASARLVRSVAFRGRVVRELSEGRETVVLGVHELHSGLHRFGHNVLPHHWYRPYEPEPGLLTDVYEAADRALAPLLERYSEGAVAVVLGDGMRVGNRGDHLLEDLLARAGLLTRRGAGVGAPGPLDERAWLTSTARRLVPESLRERVATAILPRTAQLRLASRRFRDAYLWSETRMFPVPTWSTGLLRANVRGREATGVVEPGELDALLEQATHLVLETRDADTGLPIARRVVRSREHFPGRRADRFPDLMIEWGGARPARRALHPLLGEWGGRPGAGHLWTQHSARSLVLLAGLGVRRLDGELEQDALGLAPTLLALKGVAPPSSMAGHPWADVLA